MIKRYSVDSIVEGLAALIPDDGGDTVHLEAEKYALSPNDIVDIVFEEGSVISLIKNEEEKERRLSSVKSRLHSLFKKNKKN